MKTGYIILIVIVVVIGASAFYIIKNPEKILSAAGPDIESVSLTKGKDNKKDNMIIIFRNKFVPVSLDSLFLNVEIDKKRIMKISKRDTIKIKPNAVDTLILPASIDYKNIFKIISEANDHKKDSLEISYKGYIFYNFPIIGDTKIPVDKQFTIKTPNPPEIKVEKVKIEKFSFPKIKLSVTMKIINHENIELDINSLKYSFMLGDSLLVSEGNKANRIKIAADSTTVTNIPVESNIGIIDNVLGQIIKKGGKIPFTLNSEMEISTDYETIRNIVMEVNLKDTVEIFR